MSELKPCPFCGHTPMIFNQTGLVTCRYAMCSANPQANSKEYWNKRAETEHLRLKEEECKQLQQDKAELVEFVKMIANGKTEIGESAIIHTKIHADSARALLEKHKCDQERLSEHMEV